MNGPSWVYGLKKFLQKISNKLKINKTMKKATKLNTQVMKLLSFKNPWLKKFYFNKS